MKHGIWAKLFKRQISTFDNIVVICSSLSFDKWFVLCCADDLSIPTLCSKLQNYMYELKFSSIDEIGTLIEE